MKINHKKLKTVIVAAVIVVILGAFFWPFYMDHYIKYEKKIEVGVSKTVVSGGKKKMGLETYTYKEGTEEFQKIVKIVKKYPYHCYIKTFSGMTQMYGSTESYIILTDGTDRIVFSGSGEVLINNRLYRIGYVGNERGSEIKCIRI
jgi:hypothetical protein